MAAANPNDPLPAGLVLYLGIGAELHLTETDYRRHGEVLPDLLEEAVLRSLPDEASNPLCMRLEDGAAAVFGDDPVAAMVVALQVLSLAERIPDLRVRAVLHSGPVCRVPGLAQPRMAGDGIYLARRMLERAEPGALLLSQPFVTLLGQFGEWATSLDDLGECSLEPDGSMRLFQFTPEAPRAGGPTGRTPSAGASGSRTTAPPTGIVTFLFTEIEDGSGLRETHSEWIRSALKRQSEQVSRLVSEHRGRVFRAEGDGFCCVFASPSAALSAALELQRALSDSELVHGPGETKLRVRMGVHTGPAEYSEGDYLGVSLTCASRLVAAGHGGQVLVSGSTAELLDGDLPPHSALRELGLHDLRSFGRPLKVFQLVAPGLVETFPPLRAGRTLPNNLPESTTSFVGREREVAALRSLLAHTRLLTVTGMGGAGKTRIALELAAAVVEEYPDGVWLVELARVTDPEQVPHSVAGVLGVLEEPGRSLTETLRGWCRARRLLLILDNCEHVLDSAAALAADLLTGAAPLRIFATSREPLDVAGETTLALPPLVVPQLELVAGEQPAALETLARCGSIRLFADRAQSALPSFELTGENAAAVGKICRILDGLPLAIELAAVRVRVLSLEDIAVRLGDRLRLLVGGPRSSPLRHQSLSAAIDWSYTSLSPAEAELFRSLAVFAGDFDLAAAEAISAGEHAGSFHSLELLASLVDKSLVVCEERAGQRRYRLLETLRVYALERLAEAGGEATLRECHSRYFLALVRRSAQTGVGTQTAREAAAAALEREYANVSAALWWAADHSPAAALEAADALGMFWLRRGHWREGRDVIDRAQERGPETAAGLRGRALRWAGLFAMRLARYEQAETLTRRALSLLDEAGDAKGAAVSVVNLGHVAFHRGQFAQALVLYRESLERFTALPEPMGVADAHHSLAATALAQGDYDAAEAGYQRALDLYRELCSGPEPGQAPHGVAQALHGLGNVLLARGQYEAARAAFTRSLEGLGHGGGIAARATLHTNLGMAARAVGELEEAQGFFERALTLAEGAGAREIAAIAQSGLGLAALDAGRQAEAEQRLEESLRTLRELGSQRHLAEALCRLGCVDLAARRLEEAGARLRESVQLSWSLGSRGSLPAALEALATLSVETRHPARAALLAAGAEALRRALGTPHPPIERDAFTRQLRMLLEAPDDEVQAAAARGRVLPLAELIAEALRA